MRSTVCLILMFVWVALLTAIVYDVPGDYATIQAALNACAAGDSVLVGWGTYHENLVWPEVDSISLVGLFRDKCIIDGSANGRVISFAGNWENPVVTNATKVRNFIIRNGAGSMNGVGVLCYYASPEFYNCIISDNVVPVNGMGSGGGVYCYNSNAHFTDVIIARNTAYSGGGVHIDPLSSPIFTNCVIADNTLMSPGGSYAAGIYTRYQVYPQFTNCTVTRNRYQGSAAIHLGEVSNPTFTNCTITDNDYGFRLVSDATMTLAQSTIMDNTMAGLVNAGSGNPNAIQNYWGYFGGPQHTSNPSGMGDIIEGSAVFNPWLADPNQLTPPPPPTGVTADWTLGASGYDITSNWDPSPEAGVTYVVHYGLDSLDIVQPTTFATTNTSIVVTALQPFAWHYFQVSAVRSNNVSSWVSATWPVYVGGVANDDPQAVPGISILTVSPNPFADNATIKYQTKNSGSISLKVFNLKGQLVRELLSAERSAGDYQSQWDGCDEQGRKVSAGIYLVKIISGTIQSSAKMMLIY